MANRTNRSDTTASELAALRRELSGRVRVGPLGCLRRLCWQLAVTGTYGVKWLLDVVFSALGLIVLSPVFLGIVLAIRLTSPGPAIFAQVRVGRHGRHFRFYKFRSMYVDAEAHLKDLLNQNESCDGVIFKMKRDPRVTPVGRFLRKYSLDELPQLLNVFLGDMSLVGPRPPLPSEVRNYTLAERKRLNVIPGITCLWQVSGRSDIPFRLQVEMDMDYIRRHGLWRDLLILLRTVPAILTGRGAY